MMNRFSRPISRFLVISVCILFFFSCTAVRGHAASMENRPALADDASSAVLYQPDTGEFLLLKDPDRRMRMASTTKIMTAMLAIERGTPDMLLTVPAEAAGTEGSSLYLKAGDTGSLKDFLYALLLASANDAAATIAINLSGSIDAFAEDMNRRASELGLSNTHFDNPHGLDGDSHYTTARDLALLTAEAMLNPVFREIVATENKLLSLNGGETLRSLHNHNRLLSSYAGANGVKTGFTKKSGRCLVSSAERDGVSLIAVTLSCPNDWQAHKEMLDYGFSKVQKTVIAEKGSIAFRVPILGGSASSVIASNPSEITALLSQNGEVVTEFDLLPYPTAPIKKGTPLGTVRFYQNGRQVAETVLTAEERIAPLAYKRRFLFW